MVSGGLGFLSHRPQCLKRPSHRLELTYHAFSSSFHFFFYRKLRDLGNVFIVNLGVADFIVSSFINTFAIIALVTNGDYFMPTRLKLCEFIAAVCVITCVCSVWSIASISVNRYVRICHHNQYPIIYNKRTVPWIIAGLWFCCFLIDLPNIIGGWGGHDFDNKLMMCTYDHGGADYGSTLFFIGLGFGWPWIVTVYAYLRIFLFVRKKRQALRKSQDGATRAVLGKRNGITNADASLLRSTFTIFVLFFIMWSPYALIVLFDPPHKWPDEVYVVAGFFAHTNSSINSILYAVTNKNFRDGYLKIIRCRWKNVRVGTEHSTVLTVDTGKCDQDASSQPNSNPNRHFSHHKR